jgi:hypothetical protein
VTRGAFHDRYVSTGQTAQRTMLLGGLQAGLEPLHLAGSHRVWMDGSFTTSKEKPGDNEYETLRASGQVAFDLEQILGLPAALVRT